MPSIAPGADRPTVDPHHGRLRSGDLLGPHHEVLDRGAIVRWGLVELDGEVLRQIRASREVGQQMGRRVRVQIDAERLGRVQEGVP